jgi:glycosyl transferase, family 25
LEGEILKAIADFNLISVINLPDRADRRDEIEGQLAAVALNFESPNVRLFSAIRPRETGNFDSIGTRGCFMSHLQILRNARGSKNLLILEDDLDFVPRIAELTQAALEALPANWGMFYGGCDADLSEGGSPLKRVSPSNPLRTSHFVAVNGHVIAPLVDYLEAILRRPAGHVDGGPMHIDGAYCRFREDNPQFDVFVARPELGYQRPSKTDIHHLKWFDRTFFVKDIVNVLRRHRRQQKRRSLSMN